MPGDAPEPDDLASQPPYPPLELEPPGSAQGAPFGEIAGPARQGERIVAIDVLRGFALLGILVMNVRALGSIWQTYEQPYALGGVSDLDWWVWAAGHLLTAEKMMAIFSMATASGSSAHSASRS